MRGEPHCSIVDGEGEYHRFYPERLSLLKRTDFPLFRYEAGDSVTCVYDEITERETSFSASEGHEWTRVFAELKGSFRCITPEKEEFDIESLWIDVEHEKYEHEG